MEILCAATFCTSDYRFWHARGRVVANIYFIFAVFACPVCPQVRNQDGWRFSGTFIWLRGGGGAFTNIYACLPFWSEWNKNNGQSVWEVHFWTHLELTPAVPWLTLSSEMFSVIQTYHVEKHMGLERWQWSRNRLQPYAITVVFLAQIRYLNVQVYWYSRLPSLRRGTMHNYPRFVRNALACRGASFSRQSFL